MRQFQQFQQFQELMRQQQEQGFPQGTPPPPGSLQPWGQLPKRPLWQRFLRSKLFRRLVLLLIVIIGLYAAYQNFFGSSNDDQPAHVTGGRGTAGTVVFATNPYEAVRQVYHWIAQNHGNKDTDEVCLLFTDQARDKFATDLGYSDCQTAVHGLSAKVTDPNAYAESMPGGTPTEPPDIVRISSCQDAIDGRIHGGPALGVFTVQRIAGSKDDQWRIVGHENEPQTCTAAPSTTPTTR